MKALTVRQPWAWAIMHGQKDVENRVRNLAGSYRGPLLIHAGLTLDDQDAFSMVASLTGQRIPPLGEGHPSGLRGAILGTVNLVDVHDAEDCWTGYLPRDGGDAVIEHCSEWAMPDQQHLRLADPKPFTEPIMVADLPAHYGVRGRLGLWEFPDELLPAAAA